MTGSDYFMVLGPAVIGAVIVIWIAITLYGNFRRRRYGPQQVPERHGQVSGGASEGDPGQGGDKGAYPRSDTDEQEVHPRNDDHTPGLDYRSNVTPGVPLLRRKD
jgi:hypothetical protein